MERATSDRRNPQRISALVRAAQSGDQTAVGDPLDLLIPYVRRLCGPIAMDEGAGGYDHEQRPQRRVLPPKWRAGQRSGQLSVLRSRFDQRLPGPGRRRSGVRRPVRHEW